MTSTNEQDTLSVNDRDSAHSTGASRQAAVSMFALATIHLCGLWCSLLVPLFAFRNVPSAIGVAMLTLALGTAKDAFLIWLSTQVWRGKLLSCAIGVMTLMVFSVGVGLGVIFCSSEAVPILAYGPLVLYLAFSLAIVVLLVRARLRTKTPIESTSKMSR